MDVILGVDAWGACGHPARVGSLIAEARQEYELVVVDMPALPPGSGYGAVESLAWVDHIVLVAPPTIAAIELLVGELARLRDKLAGRMEPPTLHLVLNRRAPGGIAACEFVDGVSQLWGECPRLVAEVGFSPELSLRLGRGELPLGDAALSELEGLLLAVTGRADRPSPAGRLLNRHKDGCQV